MYALLYIFEVLPLFSESNVSSSKMQRNVVKKSEQLSLL